MTWRRQEDDWPEADRRIWADLLRPSSPLDDTGGLSRLRPTSVAVLKEGYGQWMRWLAANDSEALCFAPEDRATMERLRRWLDALDRVGPMSRLNYLNGTLRVLRAAAPDMDWSAHLRLLARLRRLAGRGDPDCKAGRVLDTSVLLRAGLGYAAAAPPDGLSDLQQDVRIRTGAMIAMLALMPLRVATFSALTLGESVFVSPDRIVVSVPGALMKRVVPWEAEVPDAVLPLLRRYLDDVRPRLMASRGQHHDVFWVNDRGGPFRNGYLGIKVALATLEMTGVRVSPHLFRDAAATTLARITPHSARLIRPVLAHSGFGTAERHYIHAGTIEAGRAYAALISKRRNKT